MGSTVASAGGSIERMNGRMICSLGRFGSLSAVALLVGGCASAPRPFLWKIEKGGQPSYLLGTLHAGVSISDVPPVALERLKGSGAFVAELDARPGTKADAQAALELSPTSPGLDVLLSQPSWAALQVRLKGAPPERLKRMNPFFALYLLDDLEHREKASKFPLPSPPASVPSVPMALPSMDDALLSEARARGLVVSYLEERTPALKACVERAVARDLDERLHPRRKAAGAFDGGDELLRVSAAYRKGDLSTVTELEAAEERETAAALECTVGVRNREWAEKILRLHEVYAPAFIAVGVGHMATRTDSLLDTLRAQGFTVERIR